MEERTITKQNGNISKDKCGIYCISNSRYFYIGQSKNIKRRWRSHLNKLNAKKHENKFMQRVYDKYKFTDPFNFEIVTECDTKDLTFLESEILIHFIEKYKEKKALNLADPLNTSCTEESYKNKSEGHKNKHLSEAHRKAISEGQKGKIRPNKRIPIVQLTTDGEFVKLWEGGIKEVKEVLNIIVCLKRKTCGGFQWQKYEEWLKTPKTKLVYDSEIPVEQYTLDGEYIATYDSIAKASRATGIKHCAIDATILNIQKTGGGFIWKKKQ